MRVMTTSFKPLSLWSVSVAVRVPLQVGAKVIVTDCVPSLTELATGVADDTE